jgi:hypothetical protein
MMIFFMLNKPQGITGHQGLEAPKHSQVAALGPGRRRKWTWSYLEIPAMGNLGGLALPSWTCRLHELTMDIIPPMA